ncbi:alkaline-phosphatase-like protein [Aspergillus novoparasiticus]|uniref:Arylsulfatase n=1 Tax=Aspergillus novoparasiticus TaxID=986946 RepID=A0A5N6ENG1_9EURO|nr:alkaline-phosphatase-like protein [Aspergillus novoparasiticus]
MKAMLGTWLLWGLATAAKQPNILFILTDDQGKLIGGLDHMPKLQENLIQKGATYPKHYCSVALCCPSRANLWTGRMPHNTNITDVGLPYGGYPKVVSAGWNDNYLPIWMQEAGYDTYYVGKLWNSHTEDNYNNPYAKGFNGSDFLLDPWTYRYYNAKMTRNGETPVSYAGQYSTDVIKNKSLGFLDEALANPDRPWMLTIAPNAPHSNGSQDAVTGATWFGEPEYAPRHAQLFKDYKIPRDESFNKIIDGAVGWVADLPTLTEEEINYIDEFQRCRLRALQAVDEMVGELFEKLDKAGVLNNTYIFFSTDNGYHIGQHAMQPGKNCGYETDINIPLFIRGPGIPENQTIEVVTSHTDLAPTFLSIAGTTRDGLDGKKIPTTIDAGNADNKSEHVAIEYWGIAVPEGIYGYKSDNDSQPGNSYRNNTYKGLRLVSDDYSLYYSVWCTNDKEFYNLKDDPLQTTNLASNISAHQSYTIANRQLGQIIPRLDALMMVLKSCNGDSCREPWRQLHPKGYVNNLADALDSGFDEFYANQPKVSFSECSLGYHIYAEGPQEFNIYGSGSTGKRSEGGYVSVKRWGFFDGWL